MEDHLMEPRRAVRWTAILTALAFLALLAACQRTTEAGASAGGGATHVETRAAGGIEPSQVCFINNKYMGKPQIPVTIDGKTYYGCCPGCATTLRTDPSSRVATDPYSGATVDKASAFIARNPAEPDGVLYFESAATFAAYQQRAH
jgi:YHS domain-containing protein